MDYVDGVRLDQYVRDNKLDAAATLRLFATICEAVNFAHQRGVIHRDLKPSNILVDTEGHPRMLDFGLAKQMSAADDPLVSITGQVVGTLPYLSPEQARGHARSDRRPRRRVRPRRRFSTSCSPANIRIRSSDSWPTCCGTLPTRSPAATAPSWREGTGVQAAAASRCPLNDEIETISLKALSKEPERRYQTRG